MNAHPQEQPHDQPQFAPLDADITFTVQAEILGIRGPLEIRAQRVSSIQRVLRLLKQNNVLIEHAQAPTSDEPPTCPVHHKSMKPSKKPGAWYCSARVGEGYCDQKVG
jgi:hypothetical protein